MNTNSYILLAKNWIKSFFKMRLIFFFFLILIFLFSFISSAFLEIRNQIQKQFDDNQLSEVETERTFLGNRDFFDFNNFSPRDKNKTWSDYAYNLFCTDYLQFKWFRENTQNFQNQKLVQRIPRWTFGNEDSCFKLKGLTFDHFKTVSLPTGHSSTRIMISNFTLLKLLEEKKVFVEINYQSPYYQNSFHGQVMAKYSKTKNPKYLKLMNQLEDVFLYPVVKTMVELKMKQYFTNLTRYFNIKEMIQPQLSSATTISNQLQKGSELSINDDFSALFLLPRKIAEIKKFLELDDQVILEKSKTGSIAILQQLLVDLWKWHKNGLLDEKFDSKLSLSYSNFEELTSWLDENWLQSQKIAPFYFWLKNILTLKKEQIAQFSWLFANASLIDQKIRKNLPLKIQNWEKTQKQTATYQAKVRANKFVFAHKKQFEALYLEIKKFLKKYYGEQFLQQVNALINRTLPEFTISYHLETSWATLEKLLYAPLPETKEANLRFWNSTQKLLDYFSLFQSLAIEKLEKVIDLIEEWNLPFFPSPTESTQLSWNWQTVDENTTVMEVNQAWKKFKEILSLWKNFSFASFHLNDNFAQFLTYFSFNFQMLENFITDFKNYLTEISALVGQKSNFSQAENDVFLNFHNFFKMFDLDYYLANRNEKAPLLFAASRKNFHFLLKLRNLINSFGYDNLPIFDQQDDKTNFLTEDNNGNYLLAFFFKQMNSKKKETAKLLSPERLDILFTVVEHIFNFKIKNQIEEPALSQQALQLLADWKEEWAAARTKNQNKSIQNFFKSTIIKWIELNRLVATNKTEKVFFEKYLVSYPRITYDYFPRAAKYLKYYPDYYWRYHQLLLSEQALVIIDQKLEINSQNLLNQFLSKISHLTKQGFDQNQSIIDYLERVLPPFWKKIWKKNSFTYQTKREFTSFQPKEMKKTISQFYYQHHIVDNIFYPFDFLNKKESWQYIFDGNTNWFSFINLAKSMIAKTKEPIKPGPIMENLTKVSEKFNFSSLINGATIPYNCYLINLGYQLNYPPCLQLINPPFDIIENKLLNDGTYNKIINKLIGDFYQFEIKVLKTYHVLEQKKQLHYFFIEMNEDFHFNLVEGRLPILNNEIIISPIFARQHNLKVGDYIKEMLSITNLKIVGIATQKEFIYPVISLPEIVPSKNHKVVYLKPGVFEKTFLRKIKSNLEQYFYTKRNDLFMIDQSEQVNAQNQKANLEKILFFLTGEKNYTTTSFLINKEKVADFKIPPENYNKYSDFTLFSLDEYQKFFPYEFMYTFPFLIYQVVNYASISILVLFFFLICFVNFYMTNKKLEKQKKPIGILKASGYKTWNITSAGLPLVLLFVFILVLGWIFNVFLQNALFTILGEYFNFWFEMYVFNFQNLLIVLGLNLLAILFSFSLLWIFKFGKYNILEFIHVVVKKPNIITNKIKNFFFPRWFVSRFLFIKFNHLFFSLIWKRIAILIFIFILSSFSILTIVFIGSSETITLKQNFDQLQHHWEIDYLPSVSGNPWTRKSYYPNYGQDKIFNVKEDSEFPLKNQGIQFYIKKESDPEWLTPQIPQAQLFISEIFWLSLPLHNKIINYNFALKLLNIKENPEVNFCNLIKESFKGVVILKNKQKKCLTGVLNNFSPIAYKDPNKTIKHIPISIGAVQFIPGKDEFFTKIPQAEVLQTQNPFDFYGLNKNSRAFAFSDAARQKIFNVAPTSSVIPVVANSKFLQENNFQVGDSFQINYRKKALYYQPTQKRIKLSDWSYIMPNGKVKPFSEIPVHSKFYYGSELSTTPSFELKRLKNRGFDLFYQDEKITLLQKVKKADAKFHYLPWINIENIRLDVGKGNYVFPFVPKRGETEKLLQTKIRWWTRAIIDKKLFHKELVTVASRDNKITTFQIVDEINDYQKAKIFSWQKIANQMLDLPTTKDEEYDQYHWFNGRISQEKPEYNVFFNVAFGSAFGFTDAETFNKIDKKIFVIQNIDSIVLKKKVISNLLRYSFKIVFILLLCLFLVIIFLLVFVMNGVLEKMQGTNVKMRALGFGNRIIVLQNIQCLIIPFWISFVVTFIFTKWVLQKLLLFLNDYFPVTIFFDFSLWLILVTAFFIFFTIIFTIWWNYKKYNDFYLPAVTNLE